METQLYQVLTESLTTDIPQIIFSTLDPETLYGATTQVANVHRPQIHKLFYTTSYQTSLFPDFVQGLCRHLWDKQVKWGSGDPFSIFDATDYEEEELEDMSENRAVQRTIEQLLPLSRQRVRRTSLLIDAYCTDGCTLSELRELGLSRNLSRQDIVDLLIVLMQESFWPRPMRARQEGMQSQYLPRCFMQIEKLENVLHCSQLDVAQYTAALVYLVKSLGEGFTL